MPVTDRIDTPRPLSDQPISSANRTRSQRTRFACSVAACILLLFSSCQPATHDSTDRPQRHSSATPQRRAAKRRSSNSAATRTKTAQHKASSTKAQAKPAKAEAATSRLPTPQISRPGEVFTPAADNRQPPEDSPSVTHTHASSLFAPERSQIDERRAHSAGIRKIEGKHLTLFTDLPPAPEIDELPKVFDLAIEPWCEYFHVNAKSAAGWKMRGFLMARRERFEASGLLPDDLPEFLNGFALGGELWFYEQPSSYYRRHLLLHEGTHAFMQTFLHGMGPPWYAEGMAELMGTHRWQDGKLQLRYFPQSRDDVPQWGRIKIVKTEYEAGRAMSMDQITDYGPTAHLRNEPYGWCWAAAAFLDGHPQFADRFRRLPRRVDDAPPKFSQLFRTLYRVDRRQLSEQWQLFVVNLDYGYDLRREAIVYAPARVDNDQRQEGRTDNAIVVEIKADRGWQSTGLIVSADATYSLQAMGRYQVAQNPTTWWCEPQGVTIRYHDGQPLGKLLAAVSDQTRPLTGMTPLAHPEPIGKQRTLKFGNSGMLFLRINDSPAKLVDNAGHLHVEIRRVSH